MIVSRLVSLWRARKRPASRKVWSFRPSVEGLEERWIPAQITWLGTTSTNPMLAANWSTNSVPTPRDEAVFDNNATADMVLVGGNTLNVGKLTVTNNFADKFIVVGTLNVSMGAVAGNSTWADVEPMILRGGQLQISGNGSFVINTTGVTTDGALGTASVTGGATLKLTDLANSFDATLNVGDGSTPGTVELGGLSGDVQTTKGGNVLVGSGATFKMTESGDSPTSRGGLVQTGTTFGTFTNQGTFIRNGETTGAYTPALDYVFTNTGTLQVTANSNIKFTRAGTDGNSLINNSTGTLDLYYGALISNNGTGAYTQNGGVFQTHGDPINHVGSVLFQMNSNFLGGSVRVNIDGGYGTVEFGNNDVKLSGPVVVYLSLDGGSTDPNENGDELNISGAATLTIDNTGTSKPSLVITTESNQPAKGWHFNIFNAPHLVGQFDAASIVFQGATPPGGYTVSYPFGPPRAITLTV